MQPVRMLRRKTATRSDECIECAVSKYVKACGSEQLTDRIAFAVGKYIEATGGDMLVSATSQRATDRKHSGR